MIAAVAKTNIQRKEYSKTRKKVEKIVKARDQRDQEYQQALHAQQQQEQKEIAASPPPTPTKKNYSDDDSHPFENVHNPLRYRDPPGDRASVMGVPLVVDVPSVVERSERTGTAEVSSLPRRSGGAMQGAEEPPGSFSKRKVSLKKMLKKKLQT